MGPVIQGHHNAQLLKCSSSSSLFLRSKFKDKSHFLEIQVLGPNRCVGSRVVQCSSPLVVIEKDASSIDPNIGKNSQELATNRELLSSLGTINFWKESWKESAEGFQS